MNRWMEKSTSQFVVTGALLLLLPLLAALQYRWLGQLSDVEREQMKTNLGTAANRFTQDFDYEITQIYAALLPGREITGENKVERYVISYRKWAESTNYPGMIKSMFFADAETDGKLSLRSIDLRTRTLNSLDWPDDLSSLRDKLERQSAVMQENFRRPPEDPGPIENRPRFSPVYYLNGERSVLVFITFTAINFENGRDFRMAVPPGFVIVDLNMDYIRQIVLPALATRYFGGDGRLNYDLAIVATGEPENFIYQSANAPSPSDARRHFSNADVRSNLFHLRQDDLRNFLRNRVVRFESRRPVNRSRFRVGGFPIPPMGIMPMNEQGGLWELRVKHSAGSLEAAVNRVRLRNMLISFGILALLATSVGLLVISARRANRLARQQMDFVAGISHELRTPIAVIDSAGYNLVNGVVKSPEQMKNYGTIIRKESRMLKAMVEQVLEFAGNQPGKQKYNLQPARLNDIIDDAVASSRPLLVERGFTLEMNVAGDLPPIMADPHALSRCLQNLLNNAMKYSGESRWIGLHADAFTETQGKSVRIIVSDCGMGIPHDELARIFEPFYRGDHARSAQIRGNGLGLALVKSIAAAHGGSIEVKSSPGEGSSFILTIPSANSSGAELQVSSRDYSAPPVEAQAS